MFVLSAEQIQAADSHAINEVGIPSIVLMENACRKAASVIAETYPGIDYSNIIIAVGKGNNGGDGIGIARILAESGYEVTLVLLGAPDMLTEDSQTNFNIYKKLGYNYSIITGPKDLSSIIEKHSTKNTVLIDAIFGTGIKEPVIKNFYVNIFKVFNKSGLNVVSIDMPSGLSDKFKPEEDSVIKANLTITFQTLKTAHIYPDSNKFCGQVVIVDIGIPAKSISQNVLKVKMIIPDDIKFLEKERKLDGHKGDYGHCLNISGSVNKPGASILSSISILKSGAGLCTTAVLPQNRDILINAFPELMTKTYLEPDELVNNIENSDVILSGPGIGTESKAKKCVELILKKASSPVVLDADAINIVSGKIDLLKQNSERIKIVLTPHPGEFSKLIGKSKEEINLNRISLSSEFAVKHGVFIVLKGHHTVIASPDGEIYINQTGNPGMATAGSGDVLSGIITGFMAQFSETVSIAKILAAAVFIHGYSGDLAKKKKSEVSMTASDIIKFIPKAIKKKNDFNSKFKIS